MCYMPPFSRPESKQKCQYAIFLFLVCISPVKSCFENLTALCLLTSCNFFYIPPRQETVWRKGCITWLYSFVARLVLTIFSIDEQQRPYFSFVVLHIMTTPWHSPAYRPCSWQGPVMVKISSWRINNLKKQLPELSSNIWDGSCHRLSVGQVNPKKMEG